MRVCTKGVCVWMVVMGGLVTATLCWNTSRWLCLTAGQGMGLGRGERDILHLFHFQVYFGTQHARVYLVANYLGQNCANGMSWLIRRAALESVGGLGTFSDYLAEDFTIGKALWTRQVVCINWKIEQTPLIRSGLLTLLLTF